MHISHQYKFIFFSFPKTGSESLRALLEPFSDEKIVVYAETTEESPFYSHMSPQEVKAEFLKKGWCYDDYFKFVVVRNPWNRMVSLYEMIYRNPLKKIIRPSFDRWIKGISNHGKGAGGKKTDRWRRYGSYSVREYTCNETECLVDLVLKLEDLDKSLPSVLESLNIPDFETLSVKRVNVNPSKKKSYKSYYSEYSKNRVFELYEEEIKRFGYEF